MFKTKVRHFTVGCQTILFISQCATSHSTVIVRRLTGLKLNSNYRLTSGSNVPGNSIFMSHKRSLHHLLSSNSSCLTAQTLVSLKSTPNAACSCVTPKARSRSELSGRGSARRSRSDPALDLSDWGTGLGHGSWVGNAVFFFGFRMGG